MLHLDISKLSKISPSHGLFPVEIEEKSSLLKPYLQKIHARNQGFYKVIDDQSLVEKINNFAKQVDGNYENIVVLGIGGSALGTICLQQSLKHLFENQLSRSSKPPLFKPKLHVLDNIDPALISEIEDIIDYKTTLFIVVTKSGTTPETLAQYFYFRKKCDEKNLPAKEHFIFITDPQKGLLRKIANEEQIPSFEIPENVGGRFSVLTAVGLLPAALIGIDIEKLIAGAQKSRDQFLNENPTENPAFQLATIQYILGQKGKFINVMIPYAQKLIRFADWYRQLLAESIGKKLNNEGKEVFTGLTPINALGVTDQHSQSQLYNEGPNDKFFIFMEVENFGPEIQIPNLKPEDSSVNFLNNVSFNKLINTEKKATENALTQNDRPNITIKIDQITPETLGELFMLFEGSIAFLGEFYNVNAFDQPGVELSKNLTREYLAQ